MGNGELMLRLRAHAKVNLALRVGAIRGDGFHPVATVLQTVSLADLLYARRDPSSSGRGATPPLRLRVGGAPLPTVNTVSRAVELLANELNAGGTVTPPLEMHLHKRVPLGAGLGGGSSDAAAALTAALRLWKPGVDAAAHDELLHGLAAKIGSDVPFFLYGGTALATGRGTHVEPLDELPQTWLVLAAPKVLASTAAVYAAFDEGTGGGVSDEGTRRVPPPADANHPPRPPYRPLLDDDWMGNDLAEAAASLHPEIERVRRRVQELGGRPAQVSGSGAASFGACTDRRVASRIASKLRAEGAWAAVAVSVPAARHQCALWGDSGSAANRLG